MSSRRHTIHLEVSSGEALAACRQTLLRLGWELTGTAEDRLTGDEEFWRLDCRTAPSRIEVELRPEASGRTACDVTVRAPGFGPLTSRHLERQIAAFEEKVRAAPAQPLITDRPAPLRPATASHTNARTSD